MMVSMMSDYWLRREIASTADELVDELEDPNCKLAEFLFAEAARQAALHWNGDTPTATIEADCVLIAAAADRYSDPETRTGRMWNDISLLAREIAARIIKVRKETAR